jgi:hypothetical protein
MIFTQRILFIYFLSHRFELIAKSKVSLRLMPGKSMLYTSTELALTSDDGRLEIN